MSTHTDYLASSDTYRTAYDRCGPWMAENVADDACDQHGTRLAQLEVETPLRRKDGKVSTLDLVMALGY